MLSIDSTLQEIEEAHERGMGLKQIAKELRVGYNKLRNILGMAGFEYNDSTKKWSYTRIDDREILQRSFWSLDEYGVGKPSDKVGNTSNIESNTQGNTSNTTSIPFTKDDIEIIHKLIEQYKQVETVPATAPTITDSTDILQAIQGIQVIRKGDTTKKTFALENDLISQLDNFCDLHRIKKSDFVMMAIQDALHKFGN